MENYQTNSGSKATEKISNTNTVKAAFEKDILITRINHRYLQDILNERAEIHSNTHIQSLTVIIRAVFRYVFKYYDHQDLGILEKIEIPKKAKTREELQNKRNNYLEYEEVKELLSCFDYLIKYKKHTVRKRNYKRLNLL